MVETPLIPPRLELKFRVTEPQVRAIVRELQPFCDVDPFANAGPYGISTLYFDSPTFALHRAKLRRDHDRLKLRVRCYDGAGGEATRRSAVAHLEIKRKTGAFVRKQRVRVPMEGWWAAARGESTPLLESLSDADRRVADAFAAHVLRLAAEPAVVVRYEREAYVSRVDAYARLTVDRGLTGARASWPSSPSDWASGPSVALDRAEPGRPAFALLELKAERELPRWMASIVQRFRLERTGFSKYGRAVQALSERDQRRPAWSVMYA